MKSAIVPGDLIAVEMVKKPYVELTFSHHAKYYTFRFKDYNEPWYKKQEPAGWSMVNHIWPGDWVIRVGWGDDTITEKEFHFPPGFDDKIHFEKPKPEAISN